MRFVAVGGGVDALNLDATPDANPELPPQPCVRRIRLAQLARLHAQRRPLSRRLVRLPAPAAGSHDFRRIDAEVKQFIPLLRENWVIALRALASSTDTADGNEVPLVLLPALGGGDSLRGYPAWRFRDRNRLLLTGEYRWTAGPFVDMALVHGRRQGGTRGSRISICRTCRRPTGLA